MDNAALRPAWAQGLQVQLLSIETKLDALTQRVECTLTSSTVSGSIAPRTSDVHINGVAEPAHPCTVQVDGNMRFEAMRMYAEETAHARSAEALEAPLKYEHSVASTAGERAAEPAPPQRPATELSTEESRRHPWSERRTGRVRHTTLSAAKDWWSTSNLSSHISMRVASRIPDWVYDLRNRMEVWQSHKLERAPDEFFYRLSESMALRAVSALVILLNVAFIGMRADDALDMRAAGREASRVWLHVEVGFSAYFLAELAVRALGEEVLFFCGPNSRWNAFDTSVLLFTVVDNTLELNGDSGNMPTVWAVLRLVRIARVGRALRGFHKFRVVVFAIYSSMANLMWCFVVIALIIYVFAVLFVTGVSDWIPGLTPAESEPLLANYGTTLRASQTLFMAVTGGDDWGASLAPLSRLHSIFEILFTCYIFFMVIGVLNVVIGAFVATTSDIVAQDRDFLISMEMDRLRTLASQMKSCFEEADADKSGTLNIDEFLMHLHRKEVAAYFHALGLDPTAARRLFGLLDEDGQGAVDLDTFLEGCIHLRGQATSLDLNLLLAQNRQLSRQLQHLLGPAPGQRATGCKGSDGMRLVSEMANLRQTGPPRSLFEWQSSLRSSGDRGMKTVRESARERPSFPATLCRVAPEAPPEAHGPWP